MDYSKLHWYGDFMSHEIYGDGIEEYVVGVYSVIDFPEIIVHVNTETGKIIEAFLEDDGECGEHE